MWNLINHNLFSLNSFVICLLDRILFRMEYALFICGFVSFASCVQLCANVRVRRTFTRIKIVPDDHTAHASRRLRYNTIFVISFNWFPFIVGAAVVHALRAQNLSVRIEIEFENWLHRSNGHRLSRRKKFMQKLVVSIVERQNATHLVLSQRNIASTSLGAPQKEEKNIVRSGLRECRTSCELLPKWHCIVNKRNWIRNQCKSCGARHATWWERRNTRLTHPTKKTQ